MDDWEFQQHNDGKWSWRSVRSDSTSASVEHFESFILAMGNAILHGFKPGISKIAQIQAERRAKPRSIRGDEKK